MESILQAERCCYICGRYDVDLHHCIHGRNNRKHSDRYGLTVWLCRDHHEMIHRNRMEDLKLIRLAQRKFEDTHTRDEFRTVFGKSFL